MMEIAKLLPRTVLLTLKEAQSYIEKENANMAPSVEEIMIFAHEIHPSGSRTFIAATATEFFEKYSCMPYYDRSFYEVLNAGKPCNLFMDIEFFPE